MLTARKNESIKFGQAKLKFLELDTTKSIVDSSPAIYCGIPTVGFKRFFEAKTAGYSADMIVTVPTYAIYHVSNSELCEVERMDREGKAVYRIVQIQERFDSAPPCLQLTLQKEKVKYVDKRKTE